MKTTSIFLGILFFAMTILSYGQSTTYKYEPPKHYVGVKNTGVNMTLGILSTAWSELPEVGDEVAAFNAIGQLVGSSVYLDGNMAITIWGDDEYTREKDGCVAGTTFQLRLWKQETGKEYTLEVSNWWQGNDTYETNEISVVGKLAIAAEVAPDGAQFYLGQNQPNPARTQTSISFYLPYETECLLGIYSLDGKLIQEVQSGNLGAGNHTQMVELNRLSSGQYFYKLTTPDFSATKPMSVVR